MFLFLYSEATRKEAAHDVISFYLLYIKNNSLFLYTYVDLCSHIFLVVKKTVHRILNRVAAAQHNKQTHASILMDHCLAVCRAHSRGNFHFTFFFSMKV